MDNLNQTYPFINPPLPYAYNALEPYIDTKTMQLHHDRHLQTYVNNLNSAVKELPELQHYSLSQLLTLPLNLSPAEFETVYNNAGGVYNHIFFFDQLANNSANMPAQNLQNAINNSFGSFNNFKTQFKNMALEVFGSGYTWLALNRNCRLIIVNTKNQDNVLSINLCPLLTLDVWEHAYYLKHYNMRADYIENWFNIINWSDVESRYMNCLNQNNCR